MKFLLNMNIPRSLVRLLSRAKHSVRHAGDIGLSTAFDTVIVIEARKHDEIIITHDLDYGRILSFEDTKKPSVIIFRVRNTHPHNLFNLLSIILPKVEQFLNIGAIILIEEGHIRIRPLPIVKQSGRS